ncbi:unnamed protein product [Meloidogyne enterolobii]|uniref:Uncharacterized protein n=2 Tax=Meloidogyne enterolobii TaxID=390850 RepID=A0ACB0XN22_MELEN
MNSSEPEQIFAGGKDVKEEPASDVVDAEPCRQMEVKMEVAEELNENLATPQLQQKKRKRLPQRKRMQLKKIKAMEANKLREDKNCDATATSKVDVSAQTMNSSEPEKVSAGGKTVKMEPASDVADAEPSRQMDVKIEVAEELNENLTNPKRLSKSVRIARKKQKAALALLALIQANEGNKIGEESVCASTTMGKVDASTQTGEGKVGAATTTTTKVNASTQVDCVY